MTDTSAADAPAYTITHKQREVLDFVAAYIKTSNGVAPSLAEIAAKIDAKSSSSVHRILADLEARGWIKRIPHKSRAIMVLRE